MYKYESISGNLNQLHKHVFKLYSSDCQSSLQNCCSLSDQNCHVFPDWCTTSDWSATTITTASYTSSSSTATISSSSTEAIRIAGRFVHFIRICFGKKKKRNILHQSIPSANIPAPTPQQTPGPFFTWSNPFPPPGGKILQKTWTKTPPPGQKTWTKTPPSRKIF